MSIGHSMSGMAVSSELKANFSIMLSSANLSNQSLDNASENLLSLLAIHFAYTLTFFFKHYKVNILISTMQFLQLEVVLFIIWTTLMLSQWITTHWFLYEFINRTTATTRAYSSKYSMLGLHCSMKSMFH